MLRETQPAAILQQPQEAPTQGVSVNQCTNVAVGSRDSLDEFVATGKSLVQAARGVQLLGPQVVFTGIRRDVAQTLVDIQANLGGIMTRGTLESGISFAMGGQRQNDLVAERPQKRE